MKLSQLSPRNWNATCLKLAIVTLLAVYFYPNFTSVISGEFEYVQRVVDGDTLVLGTGERVRLISVDAPESVRPNTPVQRFGKEAADFTRRMVEGKRVRLEYDQANAANGHKDNTQQKRTLAYVFLEDGTLLNAEIIKQGYGHALTRYPFSRMEEFRHLEREAREQRRGLWSNSPIRGNDG
jgi:micrococcal nuclease